MTRGTGLRYFVSQAGLSCLRQVLGMLSAMHVWVARLALVCSRGTTARSRQLEVTYELASGPGHKGDVVTLDFTCSPLAVAAIEGLGVDLDEPGDGVRRTPFVRARRLGSDWRGCAIRCWLDWPDPGVSGGPVAVVVPDMLPRLVVQRRRSMPRPDLTSLPSAPPWLHVDTLSSLDGRRTLQIVLRRKDSFLVPVRTSGNVVISLSKRLVDALPAGGADRANALFHSLVTFFSRFLDTRLAIGLSVVTPGELGRIAVRPAGLCIGTTPEELGEGFETPLDFNVARKVAGIWWGAGCRIVGRSSREWEEAVRAALALTWIEALEDTAQFERITARLKRWRRKLFVHDWIAAPQGLARPRLVAARTLRLFHLLHESPQAVVVLRELTRATWGRSISVADFDGSVHGRRQPIPTESPVMDSRLPSSVL